MTRPKLLLADDSVTIRKVIELTFADEGIDVTTVADGAAAMTKFVETQPDIVLVDVGLPGTSGYQICEMIKADESTAHIPVLLLVGSFEPFDHDAAEHAHADGFLTKPFHSIRDLVGRVHDLLGSPASPPVDDLAVTQAYSVSPANDNDDIDQLIEQSFSATMPIESYEPEPTLESEPAYPGSDASNAETIQVSKTPIADWLDDDMIEAVSAHPPEESTGAAIDEAVDATTQYDEAPAAMVDFDAGADRDYVTGDEAVGEENGTIFVSGAASDRPRDEGRIGEDRETAFAGSESQQVNGFDWSPAAIVNDLEQSARHEPTGEVTEEFPYPDTDEIPELSSPQVDAPGDQQSLENVTPVSEELIELVARRVIERLSDKAIRDIAQEAVPRIAEKLMREALDEDGQR